LASTLQAALHTVGEIRLHVPGFSSSKLFDIID